MLLRDVVDFMHEQITEQPARHGHSTRRRRTLAGAVTVAIVAVVIAITISSGGGTATATGSASRRAAASVADRAAVSIPTGDWPQFNFTAQRAGVGPANTGVTAGDLSQLQVRTAKLPGTADSSAIELHGIRIDGRVRDVLVLTTSYGHTLAIDAATGRSLWEFTPSDIGSYVGSAQFTTATPTADADRKYVYATSPDGKIYKLAKPRSSRRPMSLMRTASTQRRRS